jgi:murein tripeptide amidase MpaA
MRITSDFDGGSITVLGDPEAPTVSLMLSPDNAADILQWFCFRRVGEPGEPRRFRVENAGLAEYHDAWQNYRVCASYDGQSWFRVPTRYEGGALLFRHRPSRRVVTYAAFAPYPYARHRRVVGRAARSSRARVDVLGETAQGRPIPAITFGESGASTSRVWMIARQHPGETMAAWCAEGIVERLLDEGDPLSAALLEDAHITVVPCVNIDGGVLGNHRTNAVGADLNRSWASPDPERSPEVFAVRAALVESGADLFLDIHGDESVPWVFAAGCEGNPGYTGRIAALEARFGELLEAADPAFLRSPGYPPDAPGEGDLSCAANWVGERFDCLSLTLELPFKEGLGQPEGGRPWSPERSYAFGRALLEATLVILPSLRA